jgi:hypothetical protein
VHGKAEAAAAVAAAGQGHTMRSLVQGSGDCSSLYTCIPATLSAVCKHHINRCRAQLRQPAGSVIDTPSL